MALLRQQRRVGGGRLFPLPVPERCDQVPVRHQPGTWTTFFCFRTLAQTADGALKDRWECRWQMPLNESNVVAKARRLLVYTIDAVNFSDKMDIIFVAEMIEKIGKFVEKFKDVSNELSWRSFWRPVVRP